MKAESVFGNNIANFVENLNAKFTEIEERAVKTKDKKKSYAKVKDVKMSETRDVFMAIVLWDYE